MNHESDNPLTPVGDDALEARIVAWILGEASSFEAAELEKLCAADPALRLFEQRMRELHQLIGADAKAGPDAEWKISSERRAKITDLLGVDVVELVPQAKTNRYFARRILLAAAACLMISVIAYSTFGTAGKSPGAKFAESRAVSYSMDASPASLSASSGKKRSVEELRRAIVQQEDAVEDKRKLLSQIIRQEGIVYRGDQSVFQGSGGFNEAADAENATKAFLALEQDKIQLENQIETLAKYDGEQMMNYAGGLSLPSEEFSEALPRYQEKKREVDALRSSGLGADHPQVVAEAEKLKSMEKEVMGATAALREDLIAKLESTKEQASRLEKRISEKKDGAIKKGLANQAFVDAKGDLESSQLALESLKVELAGEEARLAGGPEAVAEGSLALNESSSRGSSRRTGVPQKKPISNYSKLWTDSPYTVKPPPAASAEMASEKQLPQLAEAEAGQRGADGTALGFGRAGGGGAPQAEAKAKRSEPLPGESGGIADGIEGVTGTLSRMDTLAALGDSKDQPAGPTAGAGGAELRQQDQRFRYGSQASGDAASLSSLTGTATGGFNADLSKSLADAEATLPEVVAPMDPAAPPVDRFDSFADSSMEANGPAVASKPAATRAFAGKDVALGLDGGAPAESPANRPAAGVTLYDFDTPSIVPYSNQDARLSHYFATPPAVVAGPQQPESKPGQEVAATDAAAAPAPNRPAMFGIEPTPAGTPEPELRFKREVPAQAAQAGDAKLLKESLADLAPEDAAAAPEKKENASPSNTELLAQVDKAWEFQVPPNEEAQRGTAEKGEKAASDYSREDGTRGLRRQNAVAQSDQLREEGRKLVAEGNMAAAYAKQKEALDALPDAPMVKDRRDELSRMLGEAAVALAKNAQAAGQSDEAQTWAGRAIQWKVEDEAVKAILDLQPTAELSASTQPFSTFSLHVSDASFKLAKAALDRGEQPDPASIRPEEFYNAFDYGDPAPGRGEPVACALEQCAHPAIPQRNLARIAVRTGSTGRGQSTPLNLTLLLDSSGSMEREDRHLGIKMAVQQLTGLLKEGDTVSVIGFSRQPRLLVDRLPGSRAQELNTLIAQTPSEGGTNLEEGLKLAEELAKRQFNAAAQNRIVLFTDGAANLGDAQPETLQTRVEEMRQGGIAFDAAGFGADGLNDKLLERLTRNGNGRYYVVDRPEDADANFAKQLAGAFRPAAENVKVQVRFNPSRVGKYKLIGFEEHRLKKEDFRNDAVDAAEMAAEEAGNALYQIETLPGGEGEIGEVSVRFRDAASGQMVERTWTIPYEAQAPAFDQAAPSIQLAGLAAFAAEKLRNAPMADAVDFQKLSPILGKVKARYPNSQPVSDLGTMIGRLR